MLSRKHLAHSYLWLILASLCLAPSAHALQDLKFCVELLEDLSGDRLGTYVEQRRRALLPNLVIEEEGRIQTSATIIDPLESFHHALGLHAVAPKKKPAVPSDPESRTAARLPIPDVATSIATLDALFPLIGAEAITLAPGISANGRERMYNFDTMPNAYVIFNDYLHALNDGYRQLIVACEALRALIPEQRKHITRAQFAALKQNFDTLIAHTISPTVAALHQIAFNTGVFQQPYHNLVDRLSESEIEAVIRTGVLDEYLKAYFLGERIRPEIEALERDVEALR
ncbi:MAG TPA: hypothetical protein VM901_00470 [Bdellovibrionota bacterium]|jgi:hypothetical protein|nr:hypothetical protein [Bdellovibrionota bacterium]